MDSAKVLRLWVVLGLCFGAIGALAQDAPEDFGTPTADDAKQTQLEPPTNALDKDQLEFYLRHLYIWSPEFKVEVGDFKPSDIAGLRKTEVRVSFRLASQLKVFLVSEDGKHILDGARYQIADNPFRLNLDKIDMLDLPGFGTEGAAVAIVVYSDFECPHCAREARMLRTKLLEEYPHDVRVYYRDFPLPKHKWAGPAAIAGQCLRDEDDPDMYWEYFDWVFAGQKEFNPQNFNEKLNGFLAEHNIDALQVSQCLESEESAAKLKESVQEGAAVGVRSTPTMFVNGRRVGSVKWPRLKQIIDSELTYQEVVHNADDDCGCSITPEIPGFEQ